MRTPQKGEPNFSNLDDNTVRKYADTVRDMIGAFSDFPEEKEVLTRVWKCLSTECLERTFSRPEPEVKSVKPKQKILRRSKPVKLIT